MRQCLALAALVLFLSPAAPARANAPPPWPRPDPHALPQLRPETPQKIRVILEPVRGEDEQTHLRLPGRLLQDLHVDAAPAEQTSRFAWAMPSRASTIVAGLALTASFTLAGLWLARGKSRRAVGGLAVGLAGVIVLGVSGCPWDTPPSPEIVVVPSPPLGLRPDGSLAGETLLETDEKDDAVHLAIRREDLEAFVEKAAKGKAGGNAPRPNP
jgi:hypothetical protein